MKLVGEKQELKKHIGTVDISNPLSELQRKTFTIAVFNAYHELKDADGGLREMPLKAFCELSGFNSKNFEYLNEHLKTLQKTLIEYRGDANHFENISFFSYTKIKDGVFQYRFPPELEKLIYHPDQYARINILILSQIQGRYAIALYENLARYRPNKGFSSGSPKWNLEEFREIMGVADIPSYKPFKELNRRVLEPAINEINAVSDLLVKVEKIKKGRSIVALKFHIEDNLQQSLGFIPEPATAEAEAKNPLVVKMNELYGVPVLTAGEWLLQYGEPRFEQVLELTETAVESGRVKNPIGYMKKAFDEGWIQGNTATEAREHLKAQKRKKQQEANEKKRAEEEAKKQAIETEKQKAIEKVESYLESLSEDARHALYVEFYEDCEGAWFGKTLPIEKGQDPYTSDHDMIQQWFFDFIGENKLNL